jgi:hypothetical protein
MGGQHREINKTLLVGFGKKKNGASAPGHWDLVAPYRKSFHTYAIHRRDARAPFFAAQPPL